MPSTYAIIIPVQNEAECLGDVLTELQTVLGEQIGERFHIAVGLNACSDSSREIAEKHGVWIGETETSGYGHGCLAAIDAMEPEIDAYIFFAGDGANDPRDILKIVEMYEESAVPRPKFIIGVRKFDLSTWLQEFGRALPNLILGLGCAALGGQFFTDLGPLRLIERSLFEKIAPRELTWGWTIEAQIMAARFGEKIIPVEVTERPRLSGQQKVSGVSLFRSAKIGAKILAAAARTGFRTQK